MKKMLKCLAIVMAAAMGAAVFAACSKSAAYTVATNAQFKPFEYMEGSNMVGLDIDLVNDIADHAGFTVTINDMEFEAVITSVQKGVSDFGAAGLTITEDRQQNVDFSDPYYISHQEVIVRTGDPMADLSTADDVNAALIGKTIGVCTGFTGSDYVKGENGYPGIEGATAKQYPNISLAIADLRNGQVDAVIMDNVPATQAAAADANKGLVTVIDIPLTDEEYGIVVKNGNTELLGKINAAIAQFKVDGTLDDLVAKWITNAQ